MGRLDVSRNGCAKVKPSSKQLKGGVDYLVWAFCQSLLYNTEKTRVQGHQLAHSRLPPYLVRKWLACLLHQRLSEVPLEKWPGILWEPGKVLGSNIFSPLTIIGLVAPGPLWDWGRFLFQWSSHFHIKQSPSGLFPYRQRLFFQSPYWPHLKQQIFSQWNSGSDPGLLVLVLTMGFHKDG